MKQIAKDKASNDVADLVNACSAEIVRHEEPMTVGFSARFRSHRLGQITSRSVAAWHRICTSHICPSRVAILATIGILFSAGFSRHSQAQNAGQYQQRGFGQGFQNAAPLQPLGNNTRQNFSTTPGQPDFRVAAQGSSGQGLAGSNTAGGSIPAIPPGPATEQIGQEGASGQSDAAAAGSGFQMPDFVTKILAGGWLMLPLGLCSLVVATLALERLIALRRGRVIPKPFVNRFTECVEDGILSYEEATELCKEFDCPVSEVFRAALRRWGRPMLEIEQAVMDAGDRVSDSLRKYLRVFHAISNVAPLIGLLGTVIGMISAFEVISDPESLGRPELLASGISSALMTTAGGLVVAIPAYLAYMYFSSKSDRYLGEIEKLCQRVIDCISEEGLESTGSTRTKKRKAA